MRGSIRHIPLVGKFLILIGIFLIGEFIFAGLAAVVIPVFYPDVNILDFLTGLGSSEASGNATANEINALKIYQTITAIGRFLIIGLIFLYLCGENAVQFTLIKKPISTSSILLIFLITISTAFIINIIYEWNKNISFPAALKDIEAAFRSMEDLAQKQTDIFLADTNIAGLIINLFVVAVVASIAEEFFFRGVIQRTIQQSTGKIHFAIWMSAFLFSFIHLQFYGFFPRLLLGALLGYLYYWSGSLWAPITLHFINNAGAVIAMYLLKTGVVENNVAETANWVAALISIPFVFLLLKAFKKNENNLAIDNGERLDDGIFNG